jgi:hypothetical protein
MVGFARALDGAVLLRLRALGCGVQAVVWVLSVGRHHNYVVLSEQLIEAKRKRFERRPFVR